LDSERLLLFDPCRAFSLRRAHHDFWETKTRAIINKENHFHTIATLFQTCCGGSYSSLVEPESDAVARDAIIIANTTTTQSFETCRFGGH
jgi:hypothetical protein